VDRVAGGRPEGLPDFERPPVVEVALGIEFAPIPDLGAVRLARLQREWEAEYPKWVEQPALPPSAPPGTLITGFGLRFGSGAEPLRLWMLTEDERTLVQVQWDRVFLNWRRQDSAAEYPHYEALRDEFVSRWHAFELYVGAQELGPLQPLIAEFTFVNVIYSDEGELVVSDVLATLASVPELGDMLATHVQHVVSRPMEDGTPATTTIVGALDGERQGAVRLNVSTRVTLPPDGIDAGRLLAALDYAHDEGVWAFTRGTKPSMHKQWGRTL
jgi:uncharacterized protein (TIGR04255 family)